ncbi:MAG: DNA-binding protein [Firmicutes bacterium]|nr:DNA-binding protein [Bacillota bacterium]
MAQPVKKSKPPRYRTIKQCYQEIKKTDSDSAISEWCIRQIVKDNAGMYIASGNKSLVNLTALLKYLGYEEE